MYTRNDPSSLSFGRRMQALEQHAAAQAKQIDELKSGQLSSEEKLSAKELAAAKRAERARANQMLASVDSTLEDYYTLNQSLLTNAQREQLRHNVNGLQSAKAFGTPIQFNDAALARINNWKALAKSAPQHETFASNNAQPVGAVPERPFDKWLKRQNSPQGMFHRSKQNQLELEHNLMMAKSKANLNSLKPEGKHIGGLKDLNK